MTPQKIILHHSLTKDGRTVSWGAIRRYHTETLGWTDIGYQWGLELINDHYEILFGRMSNDGSLSVGAHTLGQNDRSIGVLFVGNFDLHEVPPEQWLLGIKLVRWLMVTYHIPAREIYGHRDFAGYKSCPGKKFDVDMFRLNILNWDQRLE
ncbi:peptidoglycan recognition family protein [Candidatus Latescibacterota bacterium]